MKTMLSIGIGGLAGLHVSTWGMYKDTPHEGFATGKYLRSLTLGILLGPVAANVFGLMPVSAASALLLFGVVYACERALTETWKTFFRSEDQTKYTIPMQAAILGHPIRSPWVRRVIGGVYLGLIAGGVFGVSRIDTPGDFSPLSLALTVGALGGWFSAFGGAWKDAPIEGFQPLKFLRSPVFAAAFAWPLFRLGGTPPQVVLAAIGFTVATIETWKMFRSRSSPPGKFAGKPVRFPEMLRLRTRAVPAFVTIWILVLVGFAAAFRRVA